MRLISFINKKLTQFNNNATCFPGRSLSSLWFLKNATQSDCLPNMFRHDVLYLSGMNRGINIEPSTNNVRNASFLSFLSTYNDIQFLFAGPV